MQIITVANQKGGVGKTTTVVNLVASLAAADYNVLLIDLDPQANATSSLQGIINLSIEPQEDIYRTLIRIIETGSSGRKPVDTKIKKIWIIPGTLDLAAADREFIDVDNSQFLVRKLIDEITSSSEIKFDYVIIDTPPSIGLMTINALAAAHKLIIPVQAEYLALEGLGLIFETIERIIGSLNEYLIDIYILITMFDARLKLSKAIETELREKINPDSNTNVKVCNTVIPRNVKLAEAPSHGLPVILFDPSSIGASAYIKLSKEVVGNVETSTGQGIGYSTPEEKVFSEPKPKPASRVDSFID